MIGDEADLEAFLKQTKPPLLFIWTCALNTELSVTPGNWSQALNADPNQLPLPNHQY